MTQTKRQDKRLSRRKKINKLKDLVKSRIKLNTELKKTPKRLKDKEDNTQRVIMTEENSNKENLTPIKEDHIFKH